MDKTQTEALYALNDLFNEDEERVGLDRARRLRTAVSDDDPAVWQPAAAEIAELWDKMKAQD